MAFLAADKNWLKNKGEGVVLRFRSVRFVRFGESFV